MGLAKIFFIEGSDYSGKTTLIKDAEKHLSKKGYRVLALKEPIHPFRDLLLTSGYDFGFASRRLLFAASHTYLMDMVYKNRDKYDYILVDRASMITDSIYSEMEIKRDLADKSKYALYEICAHANKVITVADNDLYGGFFKNNANLVLLELKEYDFISRLENREINTKDRYDNQSIEYRKSVWSLYNLLINNIKRGVESTDDMFKSVYVVPANNNELAITKLFRED